MDAEAKLDLLMEEPVVEAVTRDELRALLERGGARHYIGFEISGMLHLGSGLITKLVLDRLRQVGAKTTIFLADFHSQINNKMGGDLDKIRSVARNYYIPAFKSLGLDDTKFVLASEKYEEDYWALVLRIAQRTTLARGLRTMTILGRLESDLQSVAQLIYAPMQVADIFWLDADVAHAGMDQRKAHMLAREVAEPLGYKKPIALHHALLPNILSSYITKFGELGDDFQQIRLKSGKMGEQPQIWRDKEQTSPDELLKSMNQIPPEDLEVKNKMSKSQPEGCIFIHDSEEAIRRKVNKAYSTPKEIKKDKVLELCRLIVFPAQGCLEIHRDSKYGGDVRFETFGELKTAYELGSLHSQDLKASVAEVLIKLLEKPRKYFEAHPDLLEPFRAEAP